MKKEIKIGKNTVNMEATAGTPRRYRSLFHRDMMGDMVRLQKQLQKNKNTDSEFDALDLTIFENIAFIMAKQAGAEEKNVDEWLDKFQIFDIYEGLPQILELWGMETATQVENKKKLRKVAEK